MLRQGSSSGTGGDILDDALVKTLGVRKGVKASGISKSLQWV